MIRIIVVDDHSVVREGLCSLLRTDPRFNVIAEAGDGMTAVALCDLHQPELVLLDLIMQGMDGVEATRRIRSASPRTHVMILTSSEDESLTMQAFEAGAQSFLRKSIRGEYLLDAVERAAKGDAVLHPGIAQQILRYTSRRTQSPPRNPFGALTERELEVLRCLAAGGSNAKIAATLGIAEKTVRAHLSQVMSKLQLADRTEAVAYAWREGLMRPQ
ncbi:MAG: response regulator transcription factor [Rhodanobacteraceae bacterium]|nr:response regulator transcription factor [Rhodanobacteraceae bacterium]